VPTLDTTLSYLAIVTWEATSKKIGRAALAVWGFKHYVYSCDMNAD
jgi:hypothetical protein